MSTRTESSLLKRTMQVLLALAMALYFAPGLLLAPQKAWADETTVSVASWNDLEAEVSAGGTATIINITQNITAPDGTTKAISIARNVTINGGGHVVQVATPYTNDAGACLESGYSGYNVFTIDSNAVVTLNNMTVYGGKTIDGIRDDDRDYFIGGILLKSGTLNAENVTIARSYRALNIYSGASASLENCNIVSNVCQTAGGVLCKGTLVMEACSLSENRTTGGGGGAIEVKNSSGKLYANNTVIANNCSSEIGGAVNVYNSGAYLMNCTVTGNVTTANEAKYGGGIGVNGGTFHAVNSIFLDNKYKSDENDPLKASDIGLWSNSAGDVRLYHCLLGTHHDGISLDSSCQTTESSDVFASYSTEGILCDSSGSKTGSFPHPALVSKPGAHSFYAPLRNIASGSGTSNPAASGGTITYFDKSNLSAVKMSYAATGSGGSSTNTPLFDGGTTDTQVIS